MQYKAIPKIGIYAAVAALLVVSPLLAQKDEKLKHDAASLPAVLWHDPGDISSLDLANGPLGPDNAPVSTAVYTFLKEDMSGTNPKFDVKDERGVKWRVKLGEEARAETAVARLLWAAGYFADVDYYFEKIHVTGLPRLKRGREYVSPDGAVLGARLKKRQDHQPKIGTWSWFHNPFIGTREFNGLRVIMSLVNNWDLKESNNAIEVVDGQRHYLVSDVGASFGNTGNAFTRSKSVPAQYARSRFIEEAKPKYVDFVLHDRPFVLGAADIHNYAVRTHMQDVTKHIPRADALWLGQLLSRLSEQQIRDCFRASGYRPEEVDELTRTLLHRISELNAL